MMKVPFKTITKFLCQILFLAAMFIYNSNLQASVPLAKEYNMIRVGDKLNKRQVEYQVPGRSGKNVYWDFSRLNIINENSPLIYLAFLDSTIIGYEHNMCYKYRLHNDTLLQTGYSTPTIFLTYTQPVRYLPFPFSYGDSVAFRLNGVGRYCDRFDLWLLGHETLTADATGVIILPGNDTLTQVIRLRSEKLASYRTAPHEHMSPELPAPIANDSIAFYLQQDSVQMHSLVYRWYAYGYRYPIFETIENTSLLNGHEVQRHTMAYCYSPEAQVDLSDDMANRDRLDELERLEEEDAFQSAQKQKTRQTSGLEEKENTGSDEALIVYNVGFKGSELEVEIYLSKPAECTILLFDLQGRLLTNNPPVKMPAGITREKYSLTNYPTGKYLFRITVDERVYGQTVLKR